MTDLDNRLYNKAIADICKSEITRGIWPWTSKRKVRRECKTNLSKYWDSLLMEGMLEEELHRYKTTIGYEKFPNYHDIRQEGEWFIFYFDGLIVTTRHKDERIDHTIYFKDIVIEAKGQATAKATIERNSKYHICSFEVKELSEDK